MRAQLAGVPEQALPRYLRDGDRVRFCTSDAAGHAVFGAIDQRVVIRSTLQGASV